MCERACQLESRLLTLCVCVCVRRGRTVAIGWPVRGCTCCVCVCVCLFGAHGSCAREWRQQPSLSLSLILSHSPRLSHSCLTLHSDNIQGPKPLLPSSLISYSFIPSGHLSLLSRHHACGNFGLHYRYPQLLQQHLLLLGGGKGRETPLLSSGEQERNLTSLTLCFLFVTRCFGVLLSGFVGLIFD